MLKRFCSACAGTMDVPEHYERRPIKCPHCGHVGAAQTRALHPAAAGISAPAPQPVSPVMLEYRSSLPASTPPAPQPAGLPQPARLQPRDPPDYTRIAWWLSIVSWLLIGLGLLTLALSAVGTLLVARLGGWTGAEGTITLMALLTFTAPTLASGLVLLFLGLIGRLAAETSLAVRDMAQNTAQ